MVHWLVNSFILYDAAHTYAKKLSWEEVHLEVSRSREITFHVKYVNAIVFAKVSKRVIVRFVCGCGPDVECTNWWNDLSRVCIKSRVLNFPCVCHEIRDFQYASLQGQLPPKSLHIRTQPKPFPTTPSKALSSKDRHDNRQQASKHYWTDSSRLKLHPTQNLIKK